MKSKNLNESYVRSLVNKRKQGSHKGNFGHVLILAGSRGLSGAAVLSAGGALRSGAGLVTLGIPKSLQPIVSNRARPEAMTLALTETSAGTLSSSALDTILRYIHARRITSMVIGPGLGVYMQTQRLVRALLKKTRIPIVLDADGLNVLTMPSVRTGMALKKAHARLIITPHPGEFSRLARVSADAINKDRVNAAKKFALYNQLICVLKGHGTVISNGTEAMINTTGNPGMATAGAGDVLAGMIAGFIPQVKEPSLFNAALVAVYMHGLAGDMACQKNTEVGLVAGDIIEFLPRALKKVLHGQRA